MLQCLLHWVGQQMGKTKNLLFEMRFGFDSLNTCELRTGFRDSSLKTLCRFALTGSRPEMQQKYKKKRQGLGHRELARCIFRGSSQVDDILFDVHSVLEILFSNREISYCRI